MWYYAHQDVWPGEVMYANGEITHARTHRSIPNALGRVCDGKKRRKIKNPMKTRNVRFAYECVTTLNAPDEVKKKPTVYRRRENDNK
jgi:hypothetical protein